MLLEKRKRSSREIWKIISSNVKNGGRKRWHWEIGFWCCERMSTKRNAFLFICVPLFLSDRYTLWLSHWLCVVWLGMWLLHRNTIAPRRISSRSSERHLNWKFFIVLLHLTLTVIAFFLTLFFVRQQAVAVLSRAPQLCDFRTYSPSALVSETVKRKRASRIEWKISFSKWKRASKKLEAEILSAPAEEWSSMYVCRRRRHCRHHFCVLSMENFHSFCHIKLCDFIFLLCSFSFLHPTECWMFKCALCVVLTMFGLFGEAPRRKFAFCRTKKRFAFLCFEYSLLHTEACSSVDNSRNFF